LAPRGLSDAAPPCDNSGNPEGVLVIAVTATLKAKAGKEQDLARAVQALAQKVRANEPDCKLYQLARSKSDPGLFVLLERYTDDAALARHSNTDYFKAGIGEMMALVDGRPEIRLFDEL
jgi:quinol monooxygenase YgiN